MESIVEYERKMGSLKLRSLYALSFVYLCLIVHTRGQNCTISDRPHLQCRVEKVCDESLPAYTQTGDWPSAPTGFSIEPYAVPWNGGTTYYPAARFKWVAPVFGMKFLNGFRLTLLDMSNPANTLCRVFNFTGYEWQDSDKANPANFSYELKYIGGPYTYLVTLSSLPNLDSGDTKNYVTQYFRTPSFGQEHNYLNSERFQTTITVSVDAVYHEVNATFLLAPENYGFEKYTVFLLHGTSRIIADSKAVTPMAGSTYHTVMFENVCAGQYEIEVQPNTYTSENRCVCRYQGICKQFCVRTTTGAINVTGDPLGPCQYVPPTTTTTELPTTELLTTELPTTELPTTVTRSPSSTSHSPTTGGPTDGYIAGIVIAVCAAVILLAVIGVLYYKSRRKKRSQKLIATVKPRQMPPPDNYVLAEKQNNYFINFGSSDRKELISRRRVFILYFPDHEFHDQVVTDFANYLHKICGCDVRLDKWCQNEIHKLTKAEWLNHEISTAERIIIINSEGAYRTWQAAKDEKIYKRMETATPCGDMFIPGIRLISNLLNKPVIDYSRFISARFSYTHENFAVPTLSSMSSKYYLMDHIEGLFFHVHGINKDEPGAQQQAIGINEKDYLHYTTEGRDLHKSLLEAGNFIKAHPNWFNELYGEAVKTGNGLVIPYNRYDSGVDSLPSGNNTPPSVEVSADVHNVRPKLTIPTELRGDVFIPTPDADDPNHMRQFDHIHPYRPNNSYHYEPLGVVRSLSMPDNPDYDAVMDVKIHPPSELEGANNPSEYMRAFNGDYAEDDMDNQTVFTAEDCVTINQDIEIEMEPKNDDGQDNVSHTSIEV